MSKNRLLEELAAIFAQKQRQLYVAALAITRERSSAEDSVHDALLAIAALQQRPRNLEAYLYRTVRNKALHRLKHTNRFDRNINPGDFLDVQECSSSQKILANQVIERLSTLEENSRQTLIMKLFADLTFAEIANIMESSPNTAASWYHRSIEKLKEEMYEQQF